MNKKTIKTKVVKKPEEIEAVVSIGENSTGTTDDAGVSSMGEEQVKIASIAADFPNVDLNRLVNKINEIIAFINSK